MPAFGEMESSFSRGNGWPLPGLTAVHNPPLIWIGGGLEPAFPFLVHAGRNAVTAIGLYAGRAAGKAAE